MGSLAHTGAQAHQTSNVVYENNIYQAKEGLEPVGLSQVMSVMKTIELGPRLVDCCVFCICMFTTNRRTKYTSVELGNQLATKKSIFCMQKKLFKRANLQRALIKVNLVMDPMRGCRQLRSKPKTKFF